MHHPDGIFWVHTPAKRHQVCEDKISLRQVAPTILALFGLPKPEFMSMDALTEITAQL
jgi:bisphosphoglycerate-independent phosphoglycerate mutase (AlkP superfamily)